MLYKRQNIVLTIDLVIIFHIFERVVWHITEELNARSTQCQRTVLTKV
jgi:hypothetical protein